MLLLDTRDGSVVARTKSLDGYALRLAFARDGSVLYVADNTEVHAIPVTGAVRAVPTLPPTEPGAWETLVARNGFGYHTGGCVDAKGDPWIVGHNGRAFTSADDGRTWEPVALVKKFYVYGACQTVDGRVHLHGDGNIATVRDGEVSLLPMGGGESVVAMASSPAATVAASHTKLYLRKAGEDAWTKAEPEALRGGWHHALTVDDRGTFFLASGSMGKGFLARSPATGDAWERLAIEGCGALWCVVCDGDRVYAGGSGGALYRSDDRGARWERLPSPRAEGIWRSLVARGDVVYAAFADHTVHRSDDGGRRWSLVLRADVQHLLWTPRGRVIAVGTGPLYGCVDEAR